MAYSTLIVVVKLNNPRKHTIEAEVFIAGTFMHLMELRMTHQSGIGLVENSEEFDKMKDRLNLSFKEKGKKVIEAKLTKHIIDYQGN